MLPELVQCMNKIELPPTVSVTVTRVQAREDVSGDIVIVSSDEPLDSNCGCRL